MRIVTLLMALSLVAISGCKPKYYNTAFYTRDGRTKPIVAVMPLINRTKQNMAANVAWNVGQEMAAQIRGRIGDSSLFLMPEEGDLSLAVHLNECDPQSISRLLVERGGSAEFIIVTELLNHDEVPYVPAQNGPGHVSGLTEIAATLSIDFRVRVIDVRGEHPQVILQELFHHDHYIARPYLNCDYVKAAWGTEAYDRTPLGMAHARLAREIVSHIESYVQIAR